MRQIPHSIEHISSLPVRLFFAVCVFYCADKSLVQLETRMVQLPATAAIEYVAACCRTRTRTRTKTGTKTKIGTMTNCPGGLCPFPPGSMRICTV